MKCVGLLSAILLAFTCLQADGAVSESDVVRVFDPNLKLSSKNMEEILEKADLESIGFTKRVEHSVETDENGKKRIKKTVHYMVTDKCSMAPSLEQKLRQRFPRDFFSSDLGATFVREIGDRTSDRSTKYCEIGLEFHFNRCAGDSIRRGKRDVPCYFYYYCNVCLIAKIAY